MRRLSEFLYTWRKTFELLSRASPALSLAVIVVATLEALAGIGVLYGVKLLVDAISHNLTAPGAANSARVYPMLAFMAGAILVTVLVNSLGSILRMRQGLIVSEYVDEQIHDRAIGIDLKFYESPRYYDELERARHGGAQRPAQIVSNVVLTIRSVIVLVTVVVLIARIEMLLLPIILLPVSIALLVRLHYTRKLFDWRMQRAQLDRRANYLDWMLTSAVHAKELRLNRVGNFFRDQYRGLKTQAHLGQIRIEQMRLWTEFAVAIIGGAIFIVASAWLLQQSLTQHRPMGDVVLFVLLLRRAESGGSDLVGNVAKVVDDNLYLRHLFSFLSITPTIASPSSPKPIPAPLADGVTLSNISFQYEGAKDFALQDVSLHIGPGKIVALVGENGSGKTTLVKLLTRLYDPTSGVITLDGIDIRDFDLIAYRSLYSVIFQDFATYAETAGDNIRLGDVSLPESQADIARAAQQAGAATFIERLPQAYATPLTKLFDNGQDLSIGQWQRLALARALYPRSKFVILDEPTSAVDPKAEFELFEDFRARLGERGALLISHRLSTIRQADYTYVLQDGKIAEQGAHDELVAAQGKYANLFEKQAQYYR